MTPVAPKGRILSRLAFFVAPTVVALSLAGAAMLIHRSTAFDLNLIVTELSFESAATQEAQLVDKTAFSSLTMHGIERGEMDRAYFVKEGGDAHAGAPPSVPVRLSAREARGATVMLAISGLGAPAAGELDRLFLPPGGRAELAITPETPPALSMRVFDRASRVVLSMRGSWNVVLLGARIDSGTAMPIEAASSTLKLEAGEDRSFVEMWGTAAGLTLALTALADGGPSSALVSNLRVSAIGFQTQGTTGEALTTVSGDGTIALPGAPERETIEVKEGHFVVLGGPRSFWIRRLELQPERHAIRLEAGGVAESLKSGPAGGFQEHALTWFDSVWHQPRSVQLFALAVWLFPTTLAGHRFLKGLRE